MTKASLNQLETLLTALAILLLFLNKKSITVRDTKRDKVSGEENRTITSH